MTRFMEFLATFLSCPPARKMSFRRWDDMLFECFARHCNVPKNANCQPKIGNWGLRDLVDNTGSQGFFSMSDIICESWPIVVCSGGTEECPPLPDTVIITSRYPSRQPRERKTYYLLGGPWQSECGSVHPSDFTPSFVDNELEAILPKSVQ